MSEASANHENLNHYRDYLILLPRSQFPTRLRAKLDASDVLEQSLHASSARLEAWLSDGTVPVEKQVE